MYLKISFVLLKNLLFIKYSSTMKNIIAALFMSMLSAYASAQIAQKPLVKSSIPNSVKYTGKIIKAVQFSDNDGEHIVILTETGIVDGTEEDSGSASLFAYCHNVKENVPTLAWQVKDFINNCPVEIKANFLPGTFAITDLDKNGKAEIWLMYKTVCHGDVSPSNMKIIMYEGKSKHAMRGTNRVKYDDKHFMGGEYTMDIAFKNTPAVFKQYAKNLWNKNILETWQ